ncbi:MAG: hypothetical protein VB036_14595 [Propionicimonas sp.]|nr:hypothetical protein [Propionicimonas sp.]
MSTIGWVGIAIAVVGVAVGVFFLVRHRRYVAAVTARGWTRVAHPGLESCFDLQAPPFGLGYERDLSDLVSGSTASGTPFRSFKYSYRGAGPRFSERVVALQLPCALPSTFIAGKRHRVGIAGQEVAGDGLSVVCAVPELAAAVFAAVGPAVSGLVATEGGLNLSIDGNHLVAVDTPKQPDDLEAFLALLEPVARSLTGLSGFAVGLPVPGFTFFGRPDWQLVGTDDAVLDYYPRRHGGYAHRTEDLVRGSRDGIRLDAFEHHWKEDHTETTTDANGNTQTRTVTENKSEAICGFLLPFSLPALSIDGGLWAGRKVKFESIDFNKEYSVRAANSKFASDVIHPRMMEWMLASGAPGFAVDGRVVSFPVGVHDLLQVGACEDTLHGFLRRIPRFVWQDLGLTPPTNLIE